MEQIFVREIKQEDLSNGFLTSLDSLRLASNLSEEHANKVLSEILSNPNHKIAVAVLNDKVVGSATLLIEPKFIHDGGRVGHIEDVVVNKEFQKRGIGEKIIIELLRIAKEQNCYKTILDCSDEVRPFYEKIGFTLEAKCMRYNH